MTADFEQFRRTNKSIDLCAAYDGLMDKTPCPQRVYAHRYLQHVEDLSRITSEQVASVALHNAYCMGQIYLKSI